MTPKKIWGVIIIVCGIILIDRSFSTYYWSNFLQTELHLWNQELIRHLGRDYAMNLNRYDNMVDWAKFRAVMGIFIGIGMAIGGTFMIGDKKQPASKTFANELPKQNREPSDNWRM